MKHAIILTVLLCVATTPAWAGFKEGQVAIERGDYATAFREWLPLAQQGDAEAQWRLGLMYSNGTGVPQSYTEAAKWFLHAAEQGDTDGQSNLCRMYEKGEGVPQNFVQAHIWCNLAAARTSDRTTLRELAKHETAVEIRDSIAQKMTPVQIARAQALASTWQPRPERPKTSVESSPETAAPLQLVQTASPRRALVRQVQERLQAAGFNPGAIDGALGPQTRDALRWFQNTKGLSSAGEIDEKTLDALGVR
jgi:TPR repeat protein